MNQKAIPPTTRIGHVHLKVADLERALRFYRDVLEFELTQRFGSSAAFLSAGGYHHHIGLNTWESAGGPPPAAGTTGLYHLAIVYPTRAELGDALQRVRRAGIPLEGTSDHGVSEALYLRDPDDNGVELYWDRPQEEWPRTPDGGLAMFSKPLDLDSLLESRRRRETRGDRARNLSGVSAKGAQSSGMTKLGTSVQPYLFFGGRCEEALEFYRGAIGAEVLMLTRFKESPEAQPGLPDCFEDKVMHVSFRVGETTLMASDGRCEGPAEFEGFSLSITVPDEGEAERFFAALAEGGLVTMPLEKTFWAPKFGMLQDRFGVGWMVSVMHKPQPND